MNTISRPNKPGVRVIFLTALFICGCCGSGAFATTDTVQEQEPKYKYVSKPAENLFIQKSPSVSKLVSNVTAGYTQGVDSNPLLDSTHKADNYSEESVDMHFKYPVFGSILGFTNAKFGFNIDNTNYYRINDVNIFDAIGDVTIEQEIFDKMVLYTGYVFEYMWFPHSKNGTFVGNQFNAGVRQNLTDWAYQKVTYRLISRAYQYRKAELGNGNLSSKNRFDVRNQFEHEVSAYAGPNTKLKLTNQLYINDSNDQYFDYYSYLNYRLGFSVVRFFTKKLYGTAGVYYQRRNYFDRQISNGTDIERDNLYLVTTSMMYDLTKSLSFFINYSHSENHTNNPTEEYVDSVYSGGFYYSF